MAKIFNPIDISMWHGMDRKDARTKLQIDTEIRLVVWHGRINYYRKGIDVLLDAWQQITSEQPNCSFQLLLVGVGHNASLLELRLKDRGLKGVKWVNRYINDRKEIYTYLKVANIYAFPYRNEGFRVAPLEAMACGLALIAADAQGIPDILQHGEESGGIMLTNDNSKVFAKH